MKKTSLIIALMLLLALPVFGQAAETAQPAPAEETGLTQTAQAAPYGGQFNRRNRMPMNPAETAPETEESTAPAAPWGNQPKGRSPMPMKRAQMMQQRQAQMMQQKHTQMMQQKRVEMMHQIHFVDENGDGLCDLCGQEQGMMNMMPGRSNQTDRNNQAGQNSEAPGFTDADGNGVCDYFGTQQQGQGQGQNRAPHGRNRR